MHRITETHTSRWATLAWSVGWLAIGAMVLGGLGCGPNREALAKEVQAQVRADMDQKIRAEVSRRLQLELPRLEARLRARLTGKPLAPPRRPAARPTDPGSAMNAPDPAEPREPAARATNDAPPAVPPDAMEPKAPAVDPQGLVIKQVLLGKRVKDRKLEGQGTAFHVADERVYCYVDAKNAKGPQRMLQVVWHHNGKVFHKVRLRVGVGHVWRTWAYLRLRKSHVGNWRCGVLNEQGQLLAGAPFTVAE